MVVLTTFTYRGRSTTSGKRTPMPIARTLAATAAATLITLTGCTPASTDHPFSAGGNGKQSKQHVKTHPKAQTKSDSGPKLTTGQEQAVSSAQSYLDMGGMSRTGLIKQLKFEKFSLKDATFAADHIKVNWNDQAVQSAKSYLKMGGMSQSGLVQQLKFEGFTPDQATYGARVAYSK